MFWHAHNQKPKENHCFGMKTTKNLRKNIFLNESNQKHKEQQALWNMGPTPLIAGYSAWKANETVQSIVLETEMGARMVIENSAIQMILRLQAE